MALTMTDLFCGGGGSSTGAIQIPDVEIKIAANHWDLAIAVHNQNHPDADHAAADLHEEDPRYFPRTDILWASPECTKWSQASGGRYSHVTDGDDLLSLLDPELVEEDPETAIVQRSRLLMFDVLRFAEHHRYLAMVIENVVDIATQPRFADAWSLWKKSLRNLGYDFRVVSLNSMHAQAHGDPAPQSRDRIYIVCWLRGNRAPDLDAVLRPRAYCPECCEVIESQQAWKNGRTVGKYRAQYVYVHGTCGTAVEPGWLPAAAAIDWSIPGRRIGDRTKPLADKTRARIAAGIARYWGDAFHMEAGGHTYDAADPKHVSHGDPNAYYRAWSTYDVLKTLHTIESKALAIPVEGRDGKEARPMSLPGRTQTTRSETAMLVPSGGTWNEDARPANEAHRTMTTREHMGLVQLPGPGAPDAANCLNASRHESEWRNGVCPRCPADAYPGMDAPPFIAELRGGGSDARPTSDPAATFCASGNHHALVMRNNGVRGGNPARHTTPASEYLRTLTAEGPIPSLLAPYYSGTTAAKPTTDALSTVTTIEKHALIQRHNSSRTGDGAEMMTPASEVLRTLTTKGHQSLVTPGDLKAAEAQVDDCLFRMLEPHEIAAGMAFPADYHWAGNRRERVKLAGNAVTPPAARDLIAAVVDSLAGA